MLSLITNYIQDNYNNCKNPESNNNIQPKLPQDVLTHTLNFMDIETLKVFNRVNKYFNLLTSKNERFEIYRIANKIIKDSKPFIQIAEYDRSRHFMALAGEFQRAQEKCNGQMKIDLDQNNNIIITFDASKRDIPVRSFKSWLTSNPSDFGCFFTNKADIKIKSEDKKVEKAAIIAKQGIDKLLEQNESKAKSLYK